MVRKLVLITAVLLGPQALAVDTSVPDRVDTLATIQSDTTNDNVADESVGRYCIQYHPP